MQMAFVTNRDLPNLTDSDQQLLLSCAKHGVSAVPVIWDDPSAQWDQFDCTVLRSCWGYYKNIRQFRRWLDQLENANTRVVNSLSLIRWNLNKKYLLDLQKKGIFIPTTVITSIADTRPLKEILSAQSEDDFVIKPCFGGSAYGVMKVNKAQADNFEGKYRRLIDKSDVLIQTFLPEIANGEFSAVFIAGELSHTILKTPKPGEFRSNGGFGGKEELVGLSDQVREQVLRTYDMCQVDAFFARLDFVIVESKVVLIELELIEPHLFFDLKAGSSDLFVSKLLTPFA